MYFGQRLALLQAILVSSLPQSVRCTCVMIVIKHGQMGRLTCEKYSLEILTAHSLHSGIGLAGFARSALFTSTRFTNRSVSIWSLSKLAVLAEVKSPDDYIGRKLSLIYEIRGKSLTCDVTPVVNFDKCSKCFDISVASTISTIFCLMF